MATTLRVSDTTRARAAALAARSGTTIGDIVEQALDAFETAAFWQETRAALARHGHALDPDPAWERSICDGIERG